MNGRRLAHVILRAIGGIGIAIALLVACGSTTDRQEFIDDGGTGGFGGDGSATIGGRDPSSCDEAKQFKTYVGCDYYPTVAANIVQSIFDFAVVVANVGTQPANVTITGANSLNQKLTVAGGDVGIAYLPWVTALKGPSASVDDQAPTPSTSVLAKGGAYHLVSDVPVVVYQFSALEFISAGGPAGKDWSGCVDLSLPPGSPPSGTCHSYTNDASLLLPSTAMTGNYRIMGWHGDTGGVSSYFVVTGTQDGTTVTVNLPQSGEIVAGSGIAAAAGGTTTTFMLDAGDVAEIIGQQGAEYDFSGALLKADKPVQVITGVPCANIPAGVAACDHLEETVFPVETLGRHYVVIPPTTPAAQAGHWVRMFGNVDATTLTYKGTKPAGCPDFLNAAQVADCDVVTDDFEVTGDHEFGIATFMLGAELVDPDPAGASQGDPSQSFEVAVEQFRTSDVFLAPSDYNTNYVDVVAAPGTTLTLDGADVSTQLEPLTNSTFAAARLKLGAGKNGAHTLVGSNPVGIQVVGYGDYTTYEYPGGLNLTAISAVPVK